VGVAHLGDDVRVNGTCQRKDDDEGRMMLLNFRGVSAQELIVWSTAPAYWVEEQKNR